VRRVVAALVVFLLIAIMMAIAPSARAGFEAKQLGNAGTCWRTDLALRPGWTISAAWSHDGATLFVVDNRQNQILSYSETGRALGTISEAVGAQLRNFFPSIIKTDQANFLVELASGRLVTLDPSLRPIGRRNILAEGARGGVKIESMFQWDVAGGDLVTLSDLHGPGAGEWRMAFLRVPISDPSAFRILDPLPREPNRTLYRLGSPFIAGLGGTAYMLIADGTMRIYRNEKGGSTLEPMRAFPPGPDLVPILPRFQHPSDFADVMRTLERSSIPVGLYAWENFLYVVSRTPDISGTRWTLTRIDPRRDEVVGTTVLPLKASHIVVAPGPKRWAFLEKGPVEGFGTQNTGSVFLVSSSRIRGTLPENLCN
jgi:hypothetical protein